LDHVLIHKRYTDVPDLVNKYNILLVEHTLTQAKS